MSKLILLILLFSYCSNSDDMFFYLNPNKSEVLKKERDKCRRDGFLFYILNDGISDEIKYKECNDPNSTERKRNPDPMVCRRKAKEGFNLYIAAIISSCPKGLFDE